MPPAKDDRIAELEKLVAKARNDYFVNHETDVADEVYDAWQDELRELHADSPQVRAVGASGPSVWKKVAHEIPMGSLDKVNTLGEMTAWIGNVSKSASLPYEELLVTEKLDGISIAVKYVNGAFSQAVTRGDGIEGDDISTNVVKMQGIPAKLPKKFTGEFRGEIICTLTSLAKNFPDYANPRNTASGISNRLDGEGSEHLTVMIYRISEGKDDLQKRSDQFEYLEMVGFKTPNWYVTAVAPGVKTPHDLWAEYQQTKRSTLNYAIDGLVVELNSVERQLSLGDDRGNPNGAVAFKFAPVTRESVLRSILLPTGGSGRRTPVAVFDEVNLLGTKVTNASLYNWTYIRNLGLDVGARILVARANDVIPRVVSVVVGTGTTAQPKMACDSCGAESVWEGEYLVCPNTADCDAQALGRLLRYVKSLNILEWGEGVLEKLVSAGLAKSVPDLYLLKQGQIANVDRLGAKSAANLLTTLWAKNPIPLEAFIGALSIPGCGDSMFTLIADAGYDTLSKLRAITYDQLTSIKGLGPVRSQTIVDWLKKNGKIIDDSLAAGVKIKERVKGNLTGMSFCFTGKTVTKRADLEELAKNAGATVKGSVGKGLTYLVMADPSSGSTKATAAKKHGTETISEDDFLKMVS
jgi:DNA ligase (NAD+)